MTILKGIERCKFISEILDNSHYLIWAKDIEGNLLFVNKPAFELFKEISSNGYLECPIEIKTDSKNEEAKINIDGNDVWLGYSSTIITKDDGSKYILLLAVDITEEKEEMMEISKHLDEKISEWNKEKEERLKKIDERNKEMFDILSFLRTSY